MVENTAGKRLYNKILLIMTLTALGVGTLFAMILAPLSAKAANDVTFGFDYLPDILDILLLLIQLASFFVCYASIVYIIYRFSTRKAVNAVLIFIGATVYKYGLNLVSGWFLYDGVPTAKSDINFAFLSLSLNILLEAAQMLIVFLIAVVIMKKYKNLVSFSDAQAEIAGIESYETKHPVFPFAKLFSKSNPVQKAAMYTSIAVAAMRVVDRLISDILIDGLPKSLIDGLWVFAMYFSDIAVSLAGYLFMILIIQRFDISDLKLKLKYHE